MTVNICRLYRGFELFAWLCGACVGAKRAAGFDVEVRKVIDRPCDRCGKR